MKSLFILILSCAFLPLFAQQADSTGEVVFERTSIDFGKLDYGSDAVRYFNFQNNSGYSAYFMQCRPDCSCARPECPAAIFAPGQKGRLPIHYDTKRLGVFNTNITVFTSASPLPIKLTITGEVLPYKP
jgi:hypothetical protein